MIILQNFVSVKINRAFMMMMCLTLIKRDFQLMLLQANVLLFLLIVQ